MPTSSSETDSTDAIVTIQALPAAVTTIDEMPDRLPGDREERHAFLVARIRIATFLVLVVAALVMADIVIPDSQFHLDQITLVTLIAAILVLLGLGRFVGPGRF